MSSLLSSTSTSLKAVVLILSLTASFVAANDLNPADYIQTIAGGLVCSLGINQDGQLVSWGNNVYGQLGLGQEVQSSETPRVVIESEIPWRVVAAGYYSSFAIKADQSLWAFGENEKGQLGDGTTITRHTPVHIGDGFVTVAAGLTHTLGLKINGDLYAWGGNFYGSLGDGTRTGVHAPKHIHPGSKWKAIAAGGHISAGIQADGSLYIWGENYQVNQRYGATPKKIGDKLNWKNVKCTFYHCLAINTEGQVYAWGSNTNAEVSFQLYQNKQYRIVDPVLVTIANEPNIKWASIAVGSDSSMAITTDGELYAWGANNDKKLGEFTNEIKEKVKTKSPSKVVFAQQQLGPWKAVSLQYKYAIGITVNNEVFGWGVNPASVDRRRSTGPIKLFDSLSLGFSNTNSSKGRILLKMLSLLRH